MSSDYIKQKSLNHKVLGLTTNNQIKNIDCDYTEADLVALTIFSNMTLMIRAGDYTSDTLKLGGNVTLIQENGALLGTVELQNNAIVSGDLDCNNLNLTLAANATVINSKLDIATSINSNGGFLTFRKVISDVPLANDVGGGAITIDNSTLDSIGITTQLEVINSRITNSIGNCGGNLTLRGIVTGATIAQITGNLTVENSTLSGTISQVDGGVVVVYNSFIEEITSINNPTAIILRNSHIDNLDTVGAMLTLNSKNSFLGNGANSLSITFNGTKDDIILKFPLAVAQTLILGNGLGTGGFVNTRIKISANAAGAAQQLTLQDSAVDVFANNIIELDYGNDATFNLVGGATNILKRTGRLAGITTVANNYTTITDSY